MQLGNLIIVIICLLAFIIPFIILNRKGKKSKLVNELKEFAIKNNFKIDEWGQEGEIILAMDTSQNIAFFGNTNEQELAEFRFVALEKMSFCKSNRITRKIQTDDGVEEVTQKVELSFIPKSKKDETVNFVLFDEDTGNRLSNELLFSREWADKFSRRMK